MYEGTTVAVGTGSWHSAYCKPSLHKRDWGLSQSDVRGCLFFDFEGSTFVGGFAFLGNNTSSPGRAFDRELDSP